MFRFRSKLPVSDEERLWVDSSLDRLSRLLGRSRMLQTTVVLPNDTYFPDLYDGTEAALRALFRRVCNYMRVDPSRIELEIIPDETAELREILPYWRDQTGGCAGLYMQDGEESKMHIAVHGSKMKDPLALVATLSHEIGHVILLGQNLVSRTQRDMEPLTDVLTVFLGFGVFTANAAARFQQYQDERKTGWSFERLGYLSEEMYGYALAKFAAERAESEPEWADYLSTNIKSYYKRSQTWLADSKRFGGVSFG